MNTTGPESRGHTRALVAIAGAALLVALVARFSFLGEPFNNDAGLYAAMGKAVVEGRQLYAEIWDTKLPGITLLTAPLFACFGNRWAAWVAFEAIAGIVGALLLAMTVRRATRLADGTHVAGSTPFWATIACGLALLNCQRILISGFQLETPMACLAIAAGYASARSFLAPRRSSAFGWALAAGLLAGGAGTLKPTGLAVAAAAFVASIVAVAFGDRRPLWPLLAAALGLLLAVGVNVWWIGHLHVWPYLGTVVREIGLYGSGTPWAQVFAVKTDAIFLVVVWPLVATLAAARLGPRRVKPDEREITVWIWTFAIMWLAIEVVGVIAQRRVYAYHFLPIGAPATLLVGLLFARHRLGAAAAAVAVVPLLGLSCLTSLADWRLTLAGNDRRDVIDYVRTHTAPGDFVFADPVGELSVRADRRPGSRVGMLLFFANHDNAPRLFLKQVIDDLDARQCTLIVLPVPDALRARIAAWETQPVLSHNPQRTRDYRAAWGSLLDYVHDRYRVEREDLDGQQIWRRLDAGAPTTRP